MSRLIVQISQHGGPWRNLYFGHYRLTDAGQEWVAGLEPAEARELARYLNAQPKRITGAKYRTVSVSKAPDMGG